MTVNFCPSTIKCEPTQNGEMRDHHTLCDKRIRGIKSKGIKANDKGKLF